MKPISIEALRRKALARGGKLEIDGQVTNASRSRMQLPQMAKTHAPVDIPKLPAPPPAERIAEPDPVVRETVEAIGQYAAAGFLIHESNAKVLNEVKKTLQAVAEKEPEKRPVRWTFKVKRDAYHLIDTIEATAQFK